MNDKGLDQTTARFFPYSEIRPHQDKFIETIYEAIEQKRSALVEGSNGLGKTVATLSACLPKAIDEELKILYVARTHRQHDRVIEELKAISRKEVVSGVSIRGRHEMCLNTLVIRGDLDPGEATEVCELLKARDRCPYYKRIEDREDAYFETQQQIMSNPSTASEIHNLCKKTGFCPYELSKSVLAEANVAALSYLYVFDPPVRSAFLKNLETPLEKILLIVDEAHNLPETAVDVASSTLTLFAMKQAETEAKRFHYENIATFAKKFSEAIEKIATTISKETLLSTKTLMDLVQQKAQIEDPQVFFEEMHDAGYRIKYDLLNQGKYPRSFVHRLSDFMLRFLETAEDESFVYALTRYTSKQGVSTAKIEIVALDPSKVTASVFSSVFASVLISGTLEPLDAFSKIVGLPEDTIRNVAPSPFPREHVKPLICLGVTTALEKRSNQMYQKIIARIGEVVQSTPANTGIFAPSFDVLNALLAEGLRKAINRPLFCEHRHMTSSENEKMVSEFKQIADQGGAVLLGVQGGRSSEGVDYPGDEMNSVIIVGVPYAEPTPKVRAQIRYFENCFPGYGREYGYVLPAMKKASQAAGRPIRTPSDWGSMTFLDSRFATDYLMSFLPLWIRDNVTILPDEDNLISKELGVFFKSGN